MSSHPASRTVRTVSSMSAIDDIPVEIMSGLPWLATNLDVNFAKTMEYGLNPFIVGDIIKLCIAGALLPTAWLAVKKINEKR